jgi:hypothetical protein
MVGEDAEDALEVASVDDQEPVEAFGPDRADEALGGRVRLRRSHRRLDDLDALAGEDGVEVTAELAVAVADQEAKLSWSLLERPGDLARLLADPSSGRVGGAAGEVDAPATQLDEQEHVQPSQRDRLDGEEVDREHALRLCPQERAPGESASRAGRAEPGLAEDLLHGSGGDCDAEAVQFADDPLVAPARIVRGQRLETGQLGRPRL